MAEQPKKSEMTRDLIGGALFMIGSFTLVLVMMSLFNEPTEGRAPRGTAALAAQIVSAGGYTAPMFGGLGLIILGAVVVLRSRSFSIGRHLLGSLGTALGLCILLGAATDGGGGAVGAAIGGNATRALSIGVGVIVGFAALIVPAWLAWSRDLGAITQNFSQGRTGSLANTDMEGEGGGVSAAEAEALVPDAKTLAYMEHALQEARSHQPPPAPIDDPRLQGHIPPGATALTQTDAEDLTHRPPQAAANRWRPAKAGDGPDVAAGADLATEAPASLVADGIEASPAPLEADLAEPEAPVEAAPVPVSELVTAEPAEPVGLVVSEDPVTAGVAVPIDEPQVLQTDGPPTPSWEQPDLFGAEDSSSVEETATAPEEDSLEAEEAETESESASDVEEDEDEEEYEDDEEEDEEYEDDEEEEEEDEEEESDEEDEEEDDEYEDEDEDDEDEEEESEEEDEEEDEEYEDEDEDEEEEDTEPESAEEVEGEVETEAETETEVEAEPTEAAEAPDSDPEELDEDPAPPVSPAAETDSGERDVILTPAPARAPEPAPKSAPKSAPKAAASPPRPDRTPAELEDLMYQAGALFLERGRVAVSLLQRNFNLDFDDACEVLDELQNRGLIGPYLGGQRRDILLTLEEWTEKVTSA